MTSVHMCSLIMAGHMVHMTGEQLCKQMFLPLLILLISLNLAELLVCSRPPTLY